VPPGVLDEADRRPRKSPQAAMCRAVVSGGSYLWAGQNVLCRHGPAL